MKNHLKDAKWQDLRKKDIVSYMLPQLKSGQAYIKEDGKIYIKAGITHDTPWCHVKIDTDRNCLMNLSVVFKLFGFIPQRCYKCWKVVVRPKTVKQLLQLLDLELKLSQEHGYACKCGIEVREYVNALYGGYFYNNTLTEGQKCYEVVREAVSKEISPEIGVVLKRGCTEFELNMGDSLKWEYKKEHEEMEKYINEMILDNTKDVQQPETVSLYVQRKWIEYAYEHGDMTYLEFTDNKSVYEETRKYHNLEIKEVA